MKTETTTARTDTMKTATTTKQALEAAGAVATWKPRTWADIARTFVKAHTKNRTALAGLVAVAATYLVIVGIA